MDNFFEVLIFSIIGAALLFGFTFFLRKDLPVFETKSRKNDLPGKKEKSSFKTKTEAETKPNEPKTCPVCSTKLYNGETVDSFAFPSMTGGKDRFMHIRGCPYCLRGGGSERFCPVCKKSLIGEEVLVSRVFERPGKRIHVHVLGCTQCRGLGAK